MTGKGYVVIASRKTDNKQCVKHRALALSYDDTLYWSNNVASIFSVDEVPDVNDEEDWTLPYLPWNDLCEASKQIDLFNALTIKPWRFDGYLSQSPKSLNFWAYSRSPNQLAYRIAVNAMKASVKKLGKLYEARVYRMNAADLPVKLKLCKEDSNGTEALLLVKKTNIVSFAFFKEKQKR